MDGYSLTYEQHHQIAQLGNATRAQLEAVYTPEQQRQIQQGLKANVDPELIWQSLGLTLSINRI